MFSYDTPYSPGGIAVNLSTWQGFSDDFIGLDFERSTKSLYLLQKWKSIPKTQEVGTHSLTIDPLGYWAAEMLQQVV
jgi:hypothetical protein